jgi:ABC-type glycerol-3-phosphate transport system substrate-binding protein
VTLRIWLPPQFDPNSGTSAGELLKVRLAEFTAQNPGVRLEVRIKALEGAAGLLESLVAASAAAPLALPDLVALPRPLLESAALKGLLYPYDGLTSLMDDQSWYDYARQLARLQDNTYGIPFAGDALALAYRPSILGTTPHNLGTTLSLGEVLLFPAADPQALFTLALYQAAGGSVQDTEGRPSLDAAILVNTLEYDQQASLAGVMPYWLTQYATDDQVWEAFLGDQFPMAVTWASSYLSHVNPTPADLALAPLPTPDGAAFTLATGWSWALAGTDSQRQVLSARLAEFLVQGQFLSEWTYAAGYLPPRADALQGWQDETLRSMVERISLSAQLAPPADVLSSMGPALEQAVVDVLKAQSDPQTAAQTAVEQISQP